MTHLNVTILLKFLLGILLVQGAAALLVYAALENDRPHVWLLLAALGGGIGLLAAFWFTSMAGHLRKDALAREREGFSRERERLRVKAEREKTKVVKRSHQQIARERNRVQARAGLKLGASFAGLVGLGLLMLISQFVTLGLLTLSAAGGAVGGYLFRARQDRQALGADHTGLVSAAGRLIGSRVLRPARTALGRKGCCRSPYSRLPVPLSTT